MQLHASIAALSAKVTRGQERLESYTAEVSRSICSYNIGQSMNEIGNTTCGLQTEQGRTVDISYPSLGQAEEAANYHHQLSTPAEWRNEEARKFVLSLHVQSDALICKWCKDDATRVLANPSHIPRWRKGGVTGKDKWCITLCSESVFDHGRLGSSEHADARSSWNCRPPGFHWYHASSYPFMQAPLPLSVQLASAYPNKLHNMALWYIPKKSKSQPKVLSEAGAHWKAPHR